MRKRLRDQVAIVTGGGRGIGRAIALRCAAEGARVVLAARTESELRETADRIARDGGAALVIPTDVTDRAQVGSLFERAACELGPVDLLVNNAGRVAALGPTWETDPKNWWTDITVNLLGVYLCCRAALPAMISRGSGRIVNLVGGGTRKPFLFGSAYGSSKSAVMRLTETLARELEETGVTGVRVFALSPGFVRTEMTEQFEQTEEGRKWMGRLARRLEEEKDVPPDLAAGMVAEIAAGALDDLHGRYFNAQEDHDQVDNLRRRAKDIAKEDSRALRIHSD